MINDAWEDAADCEVPQPERIMASTIGTSPSEVASVDTDLVSDS